MDISGLSAFISALGILSGIFIGWWTRSRTVKQDVQEDARAGALLRADLEYIRRGVEDIKIVQQAQNLRYNELSERVTRVEESSKQAHKRIDRLEEV